MIGLDALIAAKISQAQRDGAVDDLPGAGKPLARGIAKPRALDNAEKLAARFARRE